MVSNIILIGSTKLGRGNRKDRKRSADEKWWGTRYRMSALTPKADIRVMRRHVCFGPLEDVPTITALGSPKHRAAAYP